MDRRWKGGSIGIDFGARRRPVCNSDGESSSKRFGGEPSKGRRHWQGDSVREVRFFVLETRFESSSNVSDENSGGLAERASRVIGRKTTALSLWRRSGPSPESASMFVQIEEIISVLKPPLQRGATGMMLCVARCWAREEDKSVLVLFSVPAHDGRTVAIRDLKVGGRVGLWEPLVVVEKIGMLCTRFVVL